ncbi:Druantia anti-phage system protein DruA [Gorillibacterium sp. sgz500922]|uniref:Druantia anti-phage system protein DruA n=1 Tax=Gorillibacterium sp. sgz500922 TaxID=3446694 RepID=UPI003F674452
MGIKLPSLSEKITKEQIKDKLFKSLEDQGYLILNDQIRSPLLTSKEDVRRLHLQQKRSRHMEDINFFNEYGNYLINTYFANGYEIDPERFEPELIPVSSNDWTGRLFRIATLLWSVPVSKGYGRRMRFLVIDKSNDKLAGIIALGDPVFNLKVRDDYIGWNAQDRKERLFNVMDAYVLGAIPPYNQLLVGKYIAGILSTNEIRDYFREKYKDKQTIIQRKNKPSDLVLITTTSALGKSSVYNRVYFDRNGHRRLLMDKIGFTAGFGHFHVSEDVFRLMRQFLSERNEKYASGHEFGSGPNWKMRVIKKTMELLGYSKTPVLQHGIKREVFICPLATNFKEYLIGHVSEPMFINMPIQDYTEYFKERFLIPRFQRKPEVRLHVANNIYLSLLDEFNGFVDSDGEMVY